MTTRIKTRINLVIAIFLMCIVHINTGWNEVAKPVDAPKPHAPNGRNLFVAVPGTGSYLAYAGQDWGVFDIANERKFLQPIFQSNKYGRSVWCWKSTEIDANCALFAVPKNIKHPDTLKMFDGANKLINNELNF